MTTIIKSESASSFKLEIEIPYSKDMLGSEEGLQQCLKEARAVAIKEMLKQRDPDKTPC